MKVKIAGTGSFMPERVLGNEELSTYVDTSDEWITARTGINERRISVGEATWEMGLKAAQNALINAKLDPSQIDCIICCTITPDYYLPSMACIIQGKLGADNSFCFDINAACSGFVYALDIASSIIVSKRAKNVLIVCAETISKITDYKDRTTCVLFGDGAGAVVLSESEEDGILATFLKSDGTGAKYLTARALKTVTPFSQGGAEISENENEHYLVMDGKEVYRFATKVMPLAIEEALKISGLSSSDITYLLPHQANKRIIDAVSSKYGYDESKTIINLDKYGNTSSACIPVMIDELNKEGRLKNGDILMLTGFGAGLTYGSAVIKWID